MANTNKLKAIIEPVLCRLFCDKYGCRLLHITNRDLESVFFQIHPDFVAYDKSKKILYIGEITVSGYMGGKRGDFHIGGVRKLAEVFTKFFLFNIDSNRRTILEKMHELFPNQDINSISCHLIVPEKSRFINALGYRNQLFETGIMYLDKIPLPKSTEKIVTQALNDARREMN